MSGYGMRIEGGDAIKLRLRRLGEKYGSYKLRVGYSASYAAVVHERLDVHHPVGQAKYLEQPARTYARQIGQTVARAVRNGMTIRDALLAGGHFLIEKSLPLVPVKTGFLRSSWFVKIY